MSVKVVIYSIKEVFGSKVLSLDLTGKIVEVKHNEHVIVDIPGLGHKVCNWFAYINKSYIFDDGNTVMFMSGYKKIKREFALKYLQKYILDGRQNCKNYHLKTPKRIDYKTLLNQEKL